MARLVERSAAGLPLRVARAAVYLVPIRLRVTVEHALAFRKSNLAGFVVIEAADGVAGIGEFLCRDYVTGESTDDCVDCLRRLGRRLVGAVIEEPLRFIQDLWLDENLGRGKIGALCGLELALLDLVSKRTERSIADLIGRAAVDRSATLTFSAAYPLARGAKLAALHVFYRTLMRMDQIKVKGTGDIAADLDYLMAIRRAFPYPVSVRIDLNGSLRPEVAGEYFTRMLESPHGVRWFEQPFSRHDLVSARWFQQEFADDIVLCGDESLCTVEDLERAIHTQAFRAINIRIAKHGGLLKALEIYDRAVGAGMDAQLGCLVGESSVLAYAGLHFAALAGPLRSHEGSFGTYLITWDVIRPSLRYSRRGLVPLARLPASGMIPHVDLARLKRTATWRVPLAER
ncbi:MAG: mandelate racemase/muconate lactonizing enzyme family protein [Armatimonadota bacterium]